MGLLNLLGYSTAWMRIDSWTTVNFNNDKLVDEILPIILPPTVSKRVASFVNQNDQTRAGQYDGNSHFLSIEYMRTKDVKTTQISRVRGRDLPPAWAKRANVEPDEVVQVIIGSSQRTAAKELLGIMDQMAEEAERRGLTEEKLAELLKDEN